MADLPSFTEWADAAGVSWPSRVRLLNEAIGLIAQERDDMKAMLVARGETDGSISAELDLIEAGRITGDPSEINWWCTHCGRRRMTLAAEHCGGCGRTKWANRPAGVWPNGADASPRTDAPKETT